MLRCSRSRSFSCTSSPRCSMVFAPIRLVDVVLPLGRRIARCGSASGGRFRLADRGRSHQRVSSAARVPGVASHALAGVRQLACRSAARARDRQRHEDNLDADADGRVPRRRYCCGRRSRECWLAGARGCAGDRDRRVRGRAGWTAGVAAGAARLPPDGPSARALRVRCSPPQRVLAPFDWDQARRRRRDRASDRRNIVHRANQRHGEQDRPTMVARWSTFCSRWPVSISTLCTS